MWPITSILPKSFLPIESKPCVRHIVNRIRLFSNDEITICCLRKDLPLYQHEFRDVSSVTFSTSNEPVGTVGAVREALKLTDCRDNFLVHYGDCIVGVDFAGLRRYHLADPSVVATLVATSNARSPYGKIHTSRFNQVIGFEEKPILDGWIWTGIAMLNPVINFNNDVDIAVDLFPRLIREKYKLQAYFVSGQYIDIGSLESYKQAVNLAREGRLFE